MMHLILLVVVLSASTINAQAQDDECASFVNAKTAVYPPLEKELQSRARMCQTFDRGCAGTDIQVKYTPTPLGCVALCRRRADCNAAFYGRNKLCHLRSERCLKPKIVVPRGFYYYRLNVDEKECPKGSFLYIGPPRIYTDTYCKLESKRCSGEGFYKKPWKNLTLQECIDKCSWIVTCDSVNYNAKKKLCEPIDNKRMPKAYSCSRDNLKSNAFWDVYIRKEKQELLDYDENLTKWYLCGSDIHGTFSMWYHKNCKPENDANCIAEKKCLTDSGFKTIDKICMKKCDDASKRIIDNGCSKLHPSFDDTRRCRSKYTFGVKYSDRNQAYKDHRTCVKLCKARKESDCHNTCLKQVGLKHISVVYLEECLKDASLDARFSCRLKQRDILRACEMKSCVTYL